MRLEHVGDYVLGEPIAGGGTSTVHLARRTTAPTGASARTMAVKRLRPELAGDARLALLLVEEARVTARLQHANLVPVSDVHAHAGELLLVTEYVHGVSLRAALAATQRRDDAPDHARVPVGVALAVARDVLAGLHAAHVLRGASGPLGIVHRDVSPENIVVGVDGSARLVDFGIALSAGRTRYTETGELRGKIGYLASEHVQGRTLDARADVYSLAVVLWEMLAGRPLFDASPGPQLLEQMMIGLVPPMQSFRPDVPAALVQVLERALDPERDRRPSTALLFARELVAAARAATSSEVASWVEAEAAAEVRARTEALEAFERAVAAPLEPPPAMRRPRGLARTAVRLALAGAGALVLGAIALHMRGAYAAAGRASEAPDAGVVELDPGEAPAASGAERAAGPPSSEAPPPAPPPPARGPAPAALPDVPPETVNPHAALRRRLHPGHAGRPPMSCNPPYTIGEDGTRAYKRACIL